MDVRVMPWVGECRRGICEVFTCKMDVCVMVASDFMGYRAWNMKFYNPRCSLQYLTFTHLDLSYAVQQICLYMHAPRVVNIVAETAWLRNLLWELHTPPLSATLVYCDNVSAVYLSTNPMQHQRTKHIEIDIHFVRDMVAMGRVRVLHVPSRYQYADIFTKGLPSALFKEFCTSLSVRLPLAQTVGECYWI
ncbi:ribonuclease H-like domain-containing protein [Tanacetum coccineum]